MSFISLRDNSRARTTRRKPICCKWSTCSGVRLSHCVEAWRRIGGRSYWSKLRSWIISASTPTLYNSCASAHARGYSSSWSSVLSVTSTCTPKRWAYFTNSAISLSELPAAWRAPNSGAPIYTASAPAWMAAIPTSKSRAGANNDINFEFLMMNYEL